MLRIQKEHKVIGKRLMALLLCLCMLVGLVPTFALSATANSEKGGITQGTTDRIADGNTMDDYLNVLDFSESSRYAGRVWSDKTVLTDSTLTLDKETDGVDAVITNKSDFLHVFSALGSTKLPAETVPLPLDVMIVLDVSGSMCTPSPSIPGAERLHYNTNTREFENTNVKIVHAVEALNEAVRMLMKDNPYNRVGVVAYSGNQVTCQLEPMADSNFWPPQGAIPIGRNLIDLYVEDVESGGDGLEYLKYLLPFNVDNSSIYSQSGSTSVQFAASGMTLLPLGRYTPSDTYTDLSNGEQKTMDNKDYIDPNTGENYGYFNLGNADGYFPDEKNKPWDMQVTAPQVIVTCSSTYTDPNYEAAPVVGMKDNVVRVEGATNTQAGLYTGMSTLARVNETIQDIDGVQVQRKPLVILITDGAPTASTWDGDEWWNCPDDGHPVKDTEKDPTGWKRVAAPSGDEQSPGVGDYSGNAILAMATASYWKERINEHYAEQYGAAGGKLDPDTGKGAILNDQPKCELYTIGVDMASNMTKDDPSLDASVKRSAEYTGMEPEEMMRYLGSGYDGDLVELLMDPHYALLPLEEKQALWDSDENVRLNWPNRPTTDNIFKEEVLEFWDAYQSGEAPPVEQGRVFYWMSVALIMAGLPMSIQRVVPSTGLGFNGPGTNIKGEPVTDEKYKQALEPEYETKIEKDPETGKETEVITGFTPEFQEVLEDYQLNGYMPSYKEPTKLSHPDPEKDISTLEYADGFINIDSGNNVRNLESALADILINFLNDSMVGPTEGQNTLSGITEDVVTYKDPIGRYMEIKDIDSFVMFGQQYHLEKDGDPDPVSGRQYYKISDADLEAINLEPSHKRGCYFNPCYDYTITDDLQPYERVDFKPSDIKIWVDRVERTVGSDGVEDGLETYGGFEQVLYVEIPSNALPLRTVIIEEEIDPDDPYSKTITYRTNAGDNKSEEVDKYGKSQDDYYAESTPFRLFYSVGLAEDLLKKDEDGNLVKPLTAADNIADIVDTEYLGTVDKNTGTLYFYSNWYSTVDDDGNEKKYTYSSGEQYSFGDPAMSFSPNEKNRYYIFQDNLWLYSSADETVDPDRATHIVEGGKVTGKEGNWKWEGTDVSIGTTLTDKELVRDQIYYDVVTWFECVDGEAKEIYYALPRRGQGFSSSLGDKNDDVMSNDYLHYVNKNDPTDIVDGDTPPGPDYVVAVKKGALRAGNMATSVSSKNQKLDAIGSVERNENKVTWTIDAEPGVEGVVELKVRVRDNVQDGDVIRNTATVIISDNEDHHRIVSQENPVSLDSTEVDPGKGSPVSPGEYITYRINWKNTKSETVKITIVDQLDDNVEYVEAEQAHTVNAPNHTNTAGTVYMPTVGSLSNGQEGFNSKINVYLGNNGRMAVIVPNKEEITPGDGEFVEIGDELSYNIWWQNTEEPSYAGAVVTITDPLDPGVDFIEAGYGDVILKADNGKDVKIEDKTVENNTGNVGSNYTNTETVSISYDASTHTVTWIIQNVAQYAYGKVSLSTKVNEKAKLAWGYGEDGESLPLGGESGEGLDYRVINQAGVKINDEATRWTNTTFNPLEPNKTETNIQHNDKSLGDEVEDGEKDGNEKVTQGDNLNTREDDPETWDGPNVFVGDEITYEINWASNLRDEDGKKTAATVTITDPLDPGVDLVEASCGGITLTADDDTAAGKVGKYNVKISYDDHTVTWTLTDVPYGTTGIVTLKVKVTGRATPTGSVENQATVEVGNDRKVITDKVVNPTPDPRKTEAAPGNGIPVNPGEYIPYNITWKNYKEKEATVVITDPLDENVEFISADNDGVYDEDSHTVTWTFTECKAGEEGVVEVIVRVLDDAKGVIKNQAFVRVDEDPVVETEIPENPVTNVHKTEIAPGDGKLVSSGEDITYQITWKNYKNQVATVTVTDPLDKNVAFISADNGGVYDEENHTVIWTLTEREALEEGTVELVVRVLDSALEEGIVKNQAFVRVDDDPDAETEIPENPLSNPHKTETAPGNGIPVRPGEDITYKITWRNYKENEATVVITDPLDENVEFISADNGGEYDEENHTVTWNLTAEAGEKGEVELVVRVLNGAIEKGIVKNQAFVRVDDDPVVETEIPENPVSDPHKIENDPGDGIEVKLNQQITYEISWKNYRETSADVIIRDPLDEGVDFVSASEGGVYDEETHTVIWTLTERSAGEEGIVSVVVRVNEKAYTKGEIQNQAFVKVDNDSEVDTEIPANPVEPAPPSESTTNTPSESTTNPPSETTTDTPSESTTNPPSESTTDTPSESTTNPPSESTTVTPSDPSTDTPNEQPNTGDNSHLGLWSALMIMSLLGLCGMLVYLPRKRKRSE